MVENAEPGTLSVYFGEENDAIVIALERIFIQHTGNRILAHGSHAIKHKPGATLTPKERTVWREIGTAAPTV